jgi:hypothetical protein
MLIFYKAGGIFVDREVRKMLERKLEGTSFSHPNVIQSIVDAFERDVSPESPMMRRRIQL